MAPLIGVVFQLPDRTDLQHAASSSHGLPNNDPRLLFNFLQKGLETLKNLFFKTITG